MDNESAHKRVEKESTNEVQNKGGKIYLTEQEKNDVNFVNQTNQLLGAKEKEFGSVSYDLEKLIERKSSLVKEIDKLKETSQISTLQLNAYLKEKYGKFTIAEDGEIIKVGE